MSKQRRLHLISFLVTSLGLCAEFGVALACVSVGGILPYAVVSLLCTLAFPTEGPSL